MVIFHSYVNLPEGIFGEELMDFEWNLGDVEYWLILFNHIRMMRMRMMMLLPHDYFRDGLNGFNMFQQSECCLPKF